MRRRFIGSRSTYRTQFFRESRRIEAYSTWLNYRCSAPKSQHMASRREPQAGRHVLIKNLRNPGNICVARPGCPIIMIGDGFVLTQHDLLEDKASLSKFWLSRSA